METLIKENELPVKELEKLGLYQNGQMNLSSEDLDALLAGRRTDMRSMVHLKMDGFAIRQLDAKLSLSRNEDGSVGLNLHPIYKEARLHPLLSEEEGRELQAGKLHAVQKVVEQADKKLTNLIIEYDEQTKEFVAYHPYQVEVPLKVNGETLSDKQKNEFQNGGVVELSDGTRIQHSATDSKGIRADRKALILSVLLDGGISYLVFRGVRNLSGSNDEQKEGHSKGYNEALADSMVGKSKREMEMTVGDQVEYSRASQQSRGYGHGFSR